MLLDELKRHYNQIAYKEAMLRNVGKHEMAAYYEGSKDECYYLMITFIGGNLNLKPIEYEGVQICGFDESQCAY